MKFKNVLIFEQRASTGSENDYQIGIALTAWLMYVQAYARNPSTSDFHVPVVVSPVDKRPARTYHKWLQMGVLIHKSGFDFANHFIKLPLSWASETHHTTPIFDEEGNETGDVTTTTNKEYFFQKYRENATHCLVWIKDENYSALKELIDWDDAINATNILAEKEYFEAIDEAGAFYIETDTIEE